MNTIFQIVANGLLKIAAKLHLTYNEVNIIVYYLIVPLTWTLLTDYIIKLPLLTPLFLIAWAIVYIRVRKRFRQWCDWAFMKSVDFLLWFRCIGWNYTVSSVIICVVVPIFIYTALIINCL